MKAILYTRSSTLSPVFGVYETNQKHILARKQQSTNICDDLKPKPKTYQILKFIVNVKS